MRVLQTVNINVIFNRFSCLDSPVHAILQQEYRQLIYSRIDCIKTSFVEKRLLSFNVVPFFSFVVEAWAIRNMAFD